MWAGAAGFAMLPVDDVALGLDTRARGLVVVTCDCFENGGSGSWGIAGDWCGVDGEDVVEVNVFCSINPPSVILFLPWF